MNPNTETNTAKAVSKTGQGSEITTLLRNNVREYAMFIALIVMVIVFTILNEKFVSPKNINDLMNQTGYVAVMAIGMTVILIIRHIDLSVGYVAGFTGAIAAILLAAKIPVYFVIPIVLVCGIIIGLYQGILVSFVKIPAFVITLAGMFIFRGLLQFTTAASGTIIISDDIFNAISNDAVDSSAGKNQLHLITLIIGAVIIAAIVISQILARSQKMKYNIKVNSLPIFIITQVFFAALVAAVIYRLAQYNGLPWAAVVVAIVFLVYNFVLNKTRLGRSIYGIGGNPEAAELSGINVKKVTLLTFASMSMMAALGGIMFASRFKSATPTAGSGMELDAIAASFIGGTSVYGGVGKVANTIIGALVITSLTSGLNLLKVDISLQYIAKGVIFILAVAFDIVTRNKIKS